MRHPTAIIFWSLVAAIIFWIGAAALTPERTSWRARHGMMFSGSLLAGPGAWGAMHGWGRGPHILSRDGSAPQNADVEQAIKEWLAFEGNRRLKPGPVTEKDADTFQADVVTSDGSLVQRLNIDRKSGRIRPSED